jgi:putative transposase
VLTEVGPVQIDVPRGRDGSFEPAIVRKRQRRLNGVDELVLSLTAPGLTTGEISAHFAAVYGGQRLAGTRSRGSRTRFSPRWRQRQTRPLDEV